MNNRRLILVTGGHLTPAVATIEALKALAPELGFLYVGRAVALEAGGVPSEEPEVMRRLGIPFIALSAGRFPRALNVLSILSCIRIPWGILSALYIVARTHPSCILSFGGYIAFPLALAGWFLGVPILTHEQTRIPGLTNRLIARFSRRVAVSYPETLEGFPSGKTVYTGLPLRSVLFTKAQEPSFAYEKAPILFITGGATGAITLNDLIYPAVPELIKKWMVIHQTGRYGGKKGKEVLGELSGKERSRYMPLEYVRGEDYAWIMQHATLVLGRSGANTVGEIAALGKVAICIPLPWSAGGEQEKNARYLEEHGSSKIVDQRRLSSKQLAGVIEDVMAHYEVYRHRAQHLAAGFPKDGAKRLAREVANLLELP